MDQVIYNELLKIHAKKYSYGCKGNDIHDLFQKHGIKYGTKDAIPHVKRFLEKHKDGLKMFEFWAEKWERWSTIYTREFLSTIVSGPRPKPKQIPMNQEVARTHTLPDISTQNRFSVLQEIEKPMEITTHCQ
ncbi:hypothetical protein JTB14_036201 [Gonioctena quinquepunctata]|nr:hypothetical protein JTB14_036201 [Gonioctena quinquepunctata]